MKRWQFMATMIGAPVVAKAVAAERYGRSPIITELLPYQKKCTEAMRRSLIEGAERAANPPVFLLHNGRTWTIKSSPPRQSVITDHRRKWEER